MRVFKYSGLQQKWSAEGEVFFPNDTHLVADSAYVLQTHVIVPYSDNGHMSVEEKFFNNLLSKARMSVECGIGLFKNRWRIMRDKNPMTKTEFIPSYILACCILHNLGLKEDEEFHLNLPILEEQEDLDEDENPLLVTEEQRADGEMKREAIKISVSN